MDASGVLAPKLSAPPRTERKSRILEAAAHAFGVYGFRGGSLRDIASAAGVSLTLLNHHFGSKAHLLEAVVDRHHAMCKEHATGLRALVQSVPDPHALGRLASEWVRYEFDLYTTEDGKRYLQLMVKLADEAEIDVATQRKLDCSEPVILRGLELALPGVSVRRRVRAFRAARAALHVGIRDFAQDFDADDQVATEEAIHFTTSFLLAGLSTTLA